uniref:Uncharacterized protein n=1 Tax=Romanomermis culicivorax TaxID=13658 RepID=A0A915JJW9_ROMCU
MAPMITRQDTHFRKAISPAEKVTVTQRYLATELFDPSISDEDSSNVSLDSPGSVIKRSISR